MSNYDPYRVHVFPSELGWMAIAMHQSVVMRVTFGHDVPNAAVKSLLVTSEPVEQPTPDESLVIAKLQAYAAGAREDFLDVPVDMTGMTAFQRRVVAKCREISYGETISYAGLAAQVGSPNAARAVGNVMRSNRFPLIVPCHRVVGAGGSMGGYSAPGGLDVKRRLLEREGSLSNLAKEKETARLSHSQAVLG